MLLTKGAAAAGACWNHSLGGWHRLAFLENNGLLEESLSRYFP